MKRWTLNAMAWATMVGLLLLPGCSAMEMKSPDEIAAGNQVEVLETADGETITTYKGNTFSTITMQEITTACYANESAARVARNMHYAELEGIQKTMAVMHAETMDMIKDTFGAEKCKPGTNEFDATIAYYKEQGAFRTEVVRTVGGTVMGVMKWGAIGYGVGQIAGNMGDGDRVGGDKTTVSAGRDQGINESTFSHTKSESNLRNTQVTGEGEQVINNNEPSGVTSDGEAVPSELTEEWCNGQGMTLRESTGECITYQYKSFLEMRGNTIIEETEEP